MSMSKEKFLRMKIERLQKVIQLQNDYIEQLESLFEDEEEQDEEHNFTDEELFEAANPSIDKDLFKVRPKSAPKKKKPVLKPGVNTPVSEVRVRSLLRAFEEFKLDAAQISDSIGDRFGLGTPVIQETMNKALDLLMQLRSGQITKEDLFF